MAKLHTKTKNKGGKPKKCGRCGNEIQPKQKYYTWTNRITAGKSYISRVSVRCSVHRPRPSEMQSGRTAEISAIGEQLDDALQNLRDTMDLPTFVSDIEGVIESANSLKEDIESGLENMPDGLREGDTGQQMQERIEAIEQFVDELEAAKDQIDESALDGDEFTDEIDDDEINEEIDKEIEAIAQSGDIRLAQAIDRDAKFDRIRQEKLLNLQSDKLDEIAGEFESIALEC